MHPHTRRTRPVWKHRPLVGIGAALACGLTITVLAGPPRPAAAADPTPVALDLTGIQKEIVLRDLTGQPVPGVTVTLRPADPDAGGPASAASSQGQTDAAGRLTFANLDRWIWYVSFAGTWHGRPIQAAAAQGRPPYGYSPGGGGFATRVDVAEDAESVPTAPTGSPATLQTTGFVLVAAPAGDPWIVAFDQVLPPAPPQVALAYPPPDPGGSAPPLSPVMAAAPPAPGAPRPPAPGLDLPLTALLVGGAFVFLLGRMRVQQRRAVRARPRTKGGPPA